MVNFNCKIQVGRQVAYWNLFKLRFKYFSFQTPLRSDMYFYYQIIKQKICNILKLNLDDSQIGWYVNN